MKLTSLFNKIKNGDPTAMPCWKSLRMATVEGAEAIGIALQFQLTRLRRPSLIVQCCFAQLLSMCDCLNC
jgi:hypothetical protein